MNFYMDAYTLANEATPIIIQLPPKAVYTAIAAVIVATVGICVNIFLQYKNHRNQELRDQDNRNHQLRMMEEQFNNARLIDQKGKQHEIRLLEKRFLTDKYEELSTNLAENYNWSIELKNQTIHSLTTKNYSHSGMSEIHKVTTLSILYFPRFEENLRRLYDFQFELHYLSSSFLLASRKNLKTIELRNSKKLIQIDHTGNIMEQYEDLFARIQKQELELLDRIVESVARDANKYRYDIG